MCRIQKSLYVLKQNPRAWFDKLSHAVETFDMQKSKFDHSIFYKNSNSDIILLVVYVDDIIITESDSKCILSLKSFLHSQFHTKDLGMLKYFFGVEVIRSKQRILLSQQKYVLDMLSETMASKVQLTNEGELFEDPRRYKRLVEKLNYLIVTCLDIAYSISLLSPYMSSPIISHWAAVENILCYLKEASRREILYKNHGHTIIECFSDAD